MSAERRQQHKGGNSYCGSRSSSNRVVTIIEYLEGFTKTVRAETRQCLKELKVENKRLKDLVTRKV